MKTKKILNKFIVQAFIWSIFFVIIQIVLLTSIHNGIKAGFLSMLFFGNLMISEIIWNEQL